VLLEKWYARRGPVHRLFFGEIYDSVNAVTIDGKNREELRDAIMVPGTVVASSHLEMRGS
jgi:hypothetical protein